MHTNLTGAVAAARCRHGQSILIVRRSRIFCGKKDDGESWPAGPIMAMLGVIDSAFIFPGAVHP
jgi:hypothetical protein